MGDAAGEQPDRLHLLAVMKLVFETLSLRDIARDAQYRATAPAAFAGNIEWNQAGIDPTLDAVEPDDSEFQMSRRTGISGVVHLQEPGPIVGMDDIDHGPAQYVRRGLRTNHGESCGVHLEQASVRRYNLQACRLGIKDRLKFSRTFVDAFLELSIEALQPAFSGSALH